MESNYTDKILDIATLLKKIEVWKSRKEKIVFTNGCFDILHLGHVDYLFKAASLGDHLVVALNNDHSVRRLKGINRPIQNEKSRTSIMSALGFVDAVILFEEDTPQRLIALLQPDILVKGGDWNIKDIVGSSEVIDHGGKVLTIPFIDGYSTTQIEQKIIMNHENP